MKSPKKKRIVLFILLVSFLVLAFFVANQTSERMKMSLSCKPISFEEILDPSENTAIFEGEEIGIPLLAYEIGETPVLGVSTEERWIEVDLSEQSLRAWEGGSLFLETPVSTGLPWWPTPTGEFRVWIKLRATKMEGGRGKYYYYLPNVPYVMYFENDDIPGWRGYGIHGAYWHNDFGTQRSHGCINVQPDTAGQLYYWATPVLPSGKYSIKATPENPGIRVVIHE